MVEPTQREVELECECAELLRKLGEAEPDAKRYRAHRSRDWEGFLVKDGMTRARAETIKAAWLASYDLASDNL
jgi:hypothetical protein